MINKILDRVINELHAKCGLCNHCGKKSCAGKMSGSKLPRTLNTDEVIAALTAVDAALCGDSEKP